MTKQPTPQGTETPERCPTCRLRFPIVNGKTLVHKHCRHCGLAIGNLFRDSWTNDGRQFCSSDETQRHEPAEEA
jgi:hypothetical protein